MKVTLKKVTVEAFLTAAKERNAFVNRYYGKNTLESEIFKRDFDDYCQKEEEKALDLYTESGEQISHITFMALASACYDVLGPVVEVEEKYYKMLQLLGIEVME